MKTIHLGEAIKLAVTDPKGTPRTIALDAGVHTVEDDIAEHWYVKAHMAHGGIGTPEYAHAARAAADAAFVKAKALLDEYEGLEEAAQAAFDAAELEPQAPASERLGPPPELEPVADDPKTPSPPPPKTKGASDPAS